MKHPAWITLFACLVLVASLASAEEMVLIEVNGERITSSDLDRLIMQHHRMGDMQEADTALLQRLLRRALNDELLVQEARAMGIEEEVSSLPDLIEKREKALIRLYAQKHLDLPEAADPVAVRAHFEDFYWRVQLRQLSVATREEALALKKRIEGGESMEALASELSLDTNKHRGGAHNFKYWGDVEEVLREQARNLEIGELSEPFPFRQAHALLRVEKREGPVESEFETVRGRIERDVLAMARETAWRGFVDEHLTRFPVESNAEVFADVRADADILYRGEFLKQDARPALSVDAQHSIDGTRMRAAISHLAMSMGDSDFEDVLAAAIASESETLALCTAALAEGLGEDAELRAAADAALRQTMLDRYLNEAVASRIVFRKEEFETFYEENLDRFLGPEEVKLDMLICEDEAQARDVAARLREGADFDYIRREIHGEGATSSSGSTKWTPILMFSDNIKAAIEGLAAGETTGATPFGDGWMVVKVEGRRDGQVKSLDEVEMQIREVMFQRKFDELLDDTLKQLEENSDIVRHEQNIKNYFGAES